MKLTRVIAVGVILGSVWLNVSNAQTLRDAQPPAEFPPASYKGKQYVDSRGCVYIRAGIDGNVTWVPRVSRSRKQLCGYQPTAVAGTGAAAPTAAAPTVISVAPVATPKPAAAPKPAEAPKPATPPIAATPPVRTTAAAAPRAAAKPRVVAAPSAPAATTYKPAPPAQAKPVATAPAIAPRGTPARGGCSNASAFSQQFINKEGVRCGPQKEAPITYGRGWDSSALSPSGAAAVAGLAASTRVVPRHVHENRQNTTDVVVPAGYKAVWTDDRLNPHRAERTLAPAVIRASATVPKGYKRVERKDDRLNPKRGQRTAAGDAQTDALWTRSLPRTLAPVETRPQVVVLSTDARVSPAEARFPGIFN